MSRDFSLKCETCNQDAGLDINWGGNALANALTHREALERFGHAAAAIARGKDGWHLEASGPLFVVARFLAAHEGHVVVVEDEYGALHGACGADVNCSCGSRHYCRLATGHAGEHCQ